MVCKGDGPVRRKTKTTKPITYTTDYSLGNKAFFGLPCSDFNIIACTYTDCCSAVGDVTALIFLCSFFLPLSFSLDPMMIQPMLNLISVEDPNLLSSH